MVSAPECLLEEAVTGESSPSESEDQEDLKKTVECRILRFLHIPLPTCFLRSSSFLYASIRRSSGTASQAALTCHSVACLIGYILRGMVLSFSCLGSKTVMWSSVASTQKQAS